MPEVGPFTPAEWEAWLDANHETESEVWLVSWKKATGKQELAYGQAVEVAAQFGWVDSLEKGIDAERYRTRWTPRRSRGNWTEKNIALAERLIAEGRMRPAGLRAFEAANPGDSPRNLGARRPPELQEILRREDVPVGRVPGPSLGMSGSGRMRR